MPTFRINILVRDNRPDILQADGAVLQVETLSEQAFEKELRAKMVEEATELSQATGADFIKECADVFEVLRSLSDLKGFSMEDVLAEAENRAMRLGRFNKRIFVQALQAAEGSQTAVYHRQYPEKYPEVLPL